MKYFGKGVTLAFALAALCGCASINKGFAKVFPQGSPPFDVVINGVHVKHDDTGTSITQVQPYFIPAPPPLSVKSAYPLAPQLAK